MANGNLARGLPEALPRADAALRPEAPLFDPKLDPVEAPVFEEHDTGMAKVSTSHRFRFLKAVGLAISVGASFVSWVNSFEWFAALRPGYVAVPMAITMIGASVLLPDFGIILARQGKRLIGALIFFSGVLATVFCMVTTVAALYNTHSWKTDTFTSREASIAGATLTDRLAERERLGALLAQDDGLIASTQGKIDTLTAGDTMAASSQVLQRRLNGYLAQREAHGKALEAVNADIDRLRSSAGAVPQRPDFFVFSAEIFGMTPQGVEFFVSAVPAVFLEIVAPVMVAVILFL